jgi:hypothetical protein
LIGEDGKFLSVSGPYGKMKFVTSEEFEKYMVEPEIVICEVDPQSGCPAPAPFDSSITYRGDSEDNYFKYCN